jgi:hypothetical protein
MLTAQTIRILVTAALLLHGIAHAIALGALVLQSLGGRSKSQVAVRSWLFPSTSANTAAAIAVPFWMVSTLGFLAAAMSYWGFLVGGEAWRQIAVGAAIVSSLGIALLSGIWPGSPNRQRSILNTSIAMVMNLAILITQLWLQWPQ